MRNASSNTRLPNNHLLKAAAEPMATLLKQEEMNHLFTDMARPKRSTAPKALASVQWLSFFFFGLPSSLARPPPVFLSC